MKRFVFFLGACSALAAQGAEAPADFALPLSDLRFGSVSVYSENDKYFAGTDQHYTNGFKISVLTTDLASFTSASVPQPIQEISRALGRLVLPGEAYKLGLSLGQNLYTPVNTATTAPQPNDRPYAAWLYVGVAFQVYQPPVPLAGGGSSLARLDTVELATGLVGPGALGRQVQNSVHSLIGAAPANGWGNQIHNEPGLDLGYERKWRLSTASARDGWGADLIPHLGASLGNIFTYANAGFEFRAGWHLPADFGTNLIRPSGDSNSRRRQKWSVFVFGAADGRAVARDITLDGNSFRASASIPKDPFVADFTGGLGFGTRHWQLTYSEAERTREFVGQQKASVFGSISATFYY
jgi:lipid A 3-O-deacylase